MKNALELEGIQYISCDPRPGAKRGGGAAIMSRNSSFTVRKLDVPCVGKLEVIWALARPKESGGRIKEFIVCGFYSPPRKGKNNQLVQHLVENVIILLRKYPDAGFYIAGDANKMDTSQVLRAIPHCRQLVTQPTHVGGVLDVILSNLQPKYAVPVIRPPAVPDSSNCGKPSDHSYSLAIPLCGDKGGKSREYTVSSVRPTPDSDRRLFGQLLLSVSWGYVEEANNSLEKVERLDEMVSEMVDIVFPMITVRKSSQDLPYVTAEIKLLDRRKKQEYRRHGRSDKFREMNSVFQRKLKEEAARYIDKHVSQVKNSHPGKAAKVLRNLGAAPGDHQEKDFTLLRHVECGLNVEQQREEILKYFARVSQEYPPLNLDDLKDDLRRDLLSAKPPKNVPYLDHISVKEALRTTNHTNSQAPGDLPATLRQEFYCWLTEPYIDILKEIVMSGCWPVSWKIEYGTPIPKEQLPIEGEDKLRIISITNKLSMTTEKFVLRWMWPHIQKKIDRDQFGGVAANSVSHYLIEVTNFILFNLDLKTPLATIMTLIDFSKGFNRIHHAGLIEDLHRMGVPIWILRILVSYLSDRKLHIRYKGGVSSAADLPGGVGQGTILGMWLFLLKMDLYSKGGEEDTLIGKAVTKKTGREGMARAKKKWVDDLTEVVSVNLRDVAVKVGEEALVRPLAWHARTHHQLHHDNPAQVSLNQLYVRAEKDRMVVNTAKTKTMIFSRMRHTDVEPFLTDPDGSLIEYTSKTKLLGVIINERMTTWDNKAHIESKSYKRIWILKRLERLGCEVQELVTVYIRLVRSVTEFAVPYWGPMITVEESRRLERIQRTALHVILGDRFQTYSNALDITGLERLDIRRQSLIKKFAMKTKSNPKFAHWFEKEHEWVNRTRQIKKTWKEVVTRTERYKRSAIPVMTSLLNDMETVGGDKESIVCQVCSMSFSSKRNMSLHRRFIHLDGGHWPDWSNKVM